MGKKICLDTDFLVNFLRGKKKENEFVEANEETSELATTMVNAFELYHGAYKSGRKNNVEATKDLLSRLTLLNFSLHTAEKAGRSMAELEKAGTLIDFRDLFIGTIAKHNNYPVKTNNVKDFEKIEGLNVI